MKTFSSFPWRYIILAAVASFVLSFVWYSPPLFGEIWATLSGINPENFGVFLAIVSFITYLLQATVLFAVLRAFNAKGLDGEWFTAVLLVGVTGTLYLSGGVLYLQRPLDLFYIEGGDYLLGIFVTGLILSRKV